MTDQTASQIIEQKAKEFAYSESEGRSVDQLKAEIRYYTKVAELLGKALHRTEHQN